MNSKILVKWMLLCTCLPLGQPLLAMDENLQVTPSKCVALKQGNVCYLDLDIRWHSPEAGHYCLYLALRSEPLQCWQNSKQGRFSFEFAESASTRLELRDQDNGKLLGKSEIEVKWVYSSRRRAAAWRVF